MSETTGKSGSAERLSAKSRIELNDSLGVMMERGKTGRKLAYVNEKQKAADAIAASWFKCRSQLEFRQHCARKKFQAELRNAPVLNGVLTAFRGRLFARGCAPASMEFGPPPNPSKVKSGRYNAACEPVLYLATTPTGVIAEVKTDDQEMILIAQRFRFDTKDMNIADLTGGGDLVLVPMVFDRAEHENEGESTYRSLVLAETVARCGYGGMLVPGVRGTPTDHYCNLVIFNPTPWTDWLDTSLPPVALAAHHNGTGEDQVAD